MGLAGETARHDIGEKAFLLVLFVLLGPLYDPAHQADVDGLGVECLGAGGLDPLGPPFLDQAQQPVNLAHFCPGQRVAQQGGGVLAHRRAGRRRSCAQLVDVAHGIGLLARGEVCRVGGALSRPDPGVELDQFAGEEELDRLGIGPGAQAFADQAEGHAVEGAGHLAVEVTVDDRAGPDGGVVRQCSQGQEQGRLGGPEGLGRP